MNKIVSITFILKYVFLLFILFQKLPVTSLTDVQYDEIFSSAIKRVLTEDPSPVNSSDEGEIEVIQSLKH